VIGMAYRGSHAEIVFDFGDPMGDSTCVACGECVQACPTGALMPANDVGLAAPDKKVESVCPYCGVGCLLTYHVKEGKLLRVDGREGPANHERLCVKGRYGFDYVHHPDRLTKPLIRRKMLQKQLNCSSLRTGKKFSGKQLGKRHSILLPMVSAKSGMKTVRMHWPLLAVPRAVTKKHICCKN